MYNEGLHVIDDWEDVFCETARRPAPNDIPENSDGASVVRTTFAARKERMLDMDLIRTELEAWKCDSKKCGPCLQSLTQTDAMLQWAVHVVHQMRTDTYMNKENDISTHAERCLHSQLRLSGSTLQYVVGGVQVHGHMHNNNIRAQQIHRNSCLWPLKFRTTLRSIYYVLVSGCVLRWLLCAINIFSFF